MADKRELELHLLRLVPHALRDEFITVGLVVIEPGGAFADVRFTRTGKGWNVSRHNRTEHLERLEAVLRGGLKDIRDAPIY